MPFAFLDTEFTSLTAQARLISLALVVPDGPEFDVELPQNWDLADCSDFVIEVVLPQLDPVQYGMSVPDARDALWQFLSRFDEEVIVCCDAPLWDWEFFSQLAYRHGKWPANVRNAPRNSYDLILDLPGPFLKNRCLITHCWMRVWRPGTTALRPAGARPQHDLIATQANIARCEARLSPLLDAQPRSGGAVTTDTLRSTAPYAANRTSTTNTSSRW